MPALAVPAAGTFWRTIVLLALMAGDRCHGGEASREQSEAIEGGTASLTCNIAPLIAGDKVTVVRWYRGAIKNDDEDEDRQGAPFYKYDLKGARPQHWVDPTYGDRFFFRKDDDERATLTVSLVRVPDEDVYRCRVYFVRSPVKRTHVNLTVIVAPQGVQVFEDAGPVKNGLTSSYAEGASLTLTCMASGGKPLAKVSWWRDGQLVTDDTQYMPERKKSQSVLKIENLKRNHLLAVYSCEVNNSQLQPPLVVRVAIDMYLRPLEVRLLGQNLPLSAGRRNNITCRCKGSRPPAIITWWKDGSSLEGGIVKVSGDGNTTTSTLPFTPLASDHGLILTCRASNQRIPHSEMRDTWMLKVLYPPKVTLTLGHGLDGNDIKEGADVYFECHLVANPWVLRVWWLRDGQRLLSNATAGVIVSNQTLVLQGVSRSSSGRYCCEATNSEGSSRSAPFHLRVKFEPVCGNGTGRRILGVAKDEPLRIECKVDAEPPASLFRWSFNSTPGIARELSEYTAEPGGSVLTYTPKNPTDYGTIQCWGRNELGAQRSPCTYHVVPAGKPEPPDSCTATNVTHQSAAINCKRGFGGGIRQNFALVLINAGDELIANQTSTVPEFVVDNLDPAQDYTAVIYSYNAKGWSKASPPFALKTLPTPGLNQRRSTGPTTDERNAGTTTTSSSSGAGPWLYILLAAGSTLIVAGAVGAIVFIVRRIKVNDSPTRDGRQRQRSPKREEIPLNAEMSAYTDGIGGGVVGIGVGGGGAGILVTDDKNPDLIPPSNEGLIEPLPPYTITARPSSKRNSATQMPVKPYHVTWAPILQSRNCATQTPPPHKESSV